MIKISTSPPTTNLSINKSLNLKINDINLEIHNGLNKKIICDFIGDKIFGFLELCINYDQENKKVTIYGFDDNYLLNPKLYAYFENLPETLIILNDSKKEYSQNNKIWATFHESNIALDSENLIKNIINDISLELLKSDVNEVLLTGKAPIVTFENFNNYKGLMFESTDKTYSLESTAQNIIKLQYYLDSIYIGEVKWALDSTFANVKGSSRDIPDVDGSWLNLWREKCNNKLNPDQCASLDYTRGTNNLNFCNRTVFVGGHVVKGAIPDDSKTDDVVYIFPICSKHNNYHNDNEYMTLKKYQDGVKIKYVKPKPKFNNQ